MTGKSALDKWKRWFPQQSENNTHQLISISMVKETSLGTWNLQLTSRGLSRIITLSFDNPRGKRKCHLDDTQQPNKILQIQIVEAAMPIKTNQTNYKKLRK